MIRRRWAAVFALACLMSAAAIASDHADVPLVGGVARPDLNWTDLHVFTHGSDLVLIASIDSTVPVGARTYVFATDAVFRFHISSEGDLVEEITIDVSFGSDEEGARRVPKVTAKGYKHLRREIQHGQIRVFTGPRDDPFIRGPRVGRNVAAIVLQMPLVDVLAAGGKVLQVWGTTVWPDKRGEQVELHGRALRSVQDRELNHLHPIEHPLEPDVVTIETARPSAFPNGRALTDDVVDLVPELGFRGQDARSAEGCGGGDRYVNCVTANDKPFLPDFPYLAPPH